MPKSSRKSRQLSTSSDSSSTSSRRRSRRRSSSDSKSPPRRRSTSKRRKRRVSSSDDSSSEERSKRSRERSRSKSSKASTKTKPAKKKLRRRDSSAESARIKRENNKSNNPAVNTVAENMKNLEILSSLLRSADEEIQCPLCGIIVDSKVLLEYHAIIEHKAASNIDDNDIAQRNSDGLLLISLKKDSSTQFQALYIADAENGAIYNGLGRRNLERGSNSVDKMDAKTPDSLPRFSATPECTTSRCGQSDGNESTPLTPDFDIPELDVQQPGPSNTAPKTNAATNDTLVDDLAKKLAEFQETEKQIGEKLSDEGEKVDPTANVNESPSKAAYSKPGAFDKNATVLPPKQKAQPIPQGPIACPYFQCKGVYEPTRVGVKKHLLTVHNPYRTHSDRVKCPECVLVFKNSISYDYDSIWDHFMNMHPFTLTFDAVKDGGKVGMYRCRFTDCNFIAEGDGAFQLVLNHDRDSHEDTDMHKEYECTLCKITDKDVLKHVNQKHSNIHNGYQCPLCQDWFKTYPMFLSHIVQEHDAVTEIQCHICKKVFSDPHIFRACYYSHWSQLLSCLRCKREFPVHALENHRNYCKYPLKTWKVTA